MYRVGEKVRSGLLSCVSAKSRQLSRFFKMYLSIYFSPIQAFQFLLRDVFVHHEFSRNSSFLAVITHARFLNPSPLLIRTVCLKIVSRNSTQAWPSACLSSGAETSVRFSAPYYQLSIRHIIGSSFKIGGFKMNTRLALLVTRLLIIKMFPDLSEKVVSIQEGFHVVHFERFFRIER